MILKSCYGVDIKLSQINLINTFTEDELSKRLRDYKKEKEEEIKDKKNGINYKFVFIGEAAKQLFGMDVKKVEVHGNKTTVTYENGEVIVDVKPKLKFIKKKKKNKTIISSTSKKEIAVFQ